jgi:hypothetical protein
MMLCDRNESKGSEPSLVLVTCPNKLPSMVANAGFLEVPMTVLVRRTASTICYCRAIKMGSRCSCDMKCSTSSLTASAGEDTKPIPP